MGAQILWPSPVSLTHAESTLLTCQMEEWVGSTGQKPKENGGVDYSEEGTESGVSIRLRIREHMTRDAIGCISLRVL